MRPIVVGGGPAGLTASYELLRHGVPSLVLEADPVRVGGLSQTAVYKSFRFDIGGHRFFSKNVDIERLWAEVLGPELLEVPRKSRIFYKGRLFDYPLRPLNAFLQLGPWESVACVASYLYAQLFPRHPVRSFEDWVVNHFGHRLYRIFFKTYTEKVWGMPCTEISADWAAQRIQGLSLWRAVTSALFGRGSGQGLMKTLIDTFRYPRLGPGMMWERMALLLEEGGCEVRLGAPVTRIRSDDGALRVTWRSDGQDFTEDTRHVISSMPMRELIACLDPAPPEEVSEAAASLRYRDFLTVVLIVNQAEVFDDNWIYVHDPGVLVGRVQNYKSWSRDMVPDPAYTGLGLEYFCFDDDALWNSPDEALLDMARRELDQLGLAPASAVVDGTVVRMKKAYPVYDEGYRSKVAVIREYLEKHVPGLQVVGRNGMHRYNNQDHAMMTGILAARNALGESFDVWRVNSDACYLEDASDDEREAPVLPPPGR